LPFLVEVTDGFADQEDCLVQPAAPQVMVFLEAPLDALPVDAELGGLALKRLGSLEPLAQRGRLRVGQPLLQRRKILQGAAPLKRP
jgi:hypothetical protein